MQPDQYLRSELLTRAGFSHAFFTRQGGVSEGPFAALNTSPDVGDRREHVAENLRRIREVLGVAPARLYVPRQVHGREVRVVGSELAPDAVAVIAADALVTSQPGLACAVRTADCVPILLADPERRRVAAIHAGWRGVAQNIVRATLEAMTLLGSRPPAIIAAIGPHISASAFEVGEEVASELARASAAEGAIRRLTGQKPHVDLASIVAAQLCAAGLDRQNLERILGCTYAEDTRFFSYRRDGQRSGRMLSAIVPGAENGDAPLAPEAPPQPQREPM